LSQVNNPLILETEHEKVLGVNLRIAIFREQLEDQTFINMDSGNFVAVRVWRHVGYADLTSICRRGINEIENNKAIGKLYGYEALAKSLSGIYPISEEEIKKLVEDYKGNGHLRGVFVLKSDLVPIDKAKYNGKNEFLLVAKLPNRDQFNELINGQLKALGSNLRVKSSLKWKLVES